MAQIMLRNIILSRHMALHQQKMTSLFSNNFRLLSTAAFSTKLHDEMALMKTAPAATGYLRGFGVLPS